MWDQEEYMGDNSYKINNKFNQEPDFDDPEWHEKVTDWGEFWCVSASACTSHACYHPIHHAWSPRNYQKWDLEVEGLDDEHDVAGRPVNSPERIMKLFAALKRMRQQPGEVRLSTMPMNFKDQLSMWDNPPEPDRMPVNPVYSTCDLRAIAEKRRRSVRPSLELGDSFLFPIRRSFVRTQEGHHGQGVAAAAEPGGPPAISASRQLQARRSPNKV